MSICIGGADLAGDWSPFLDRLPDWERVADGWRSPSSYARSGCARTQVLLSGYESQLLSDTQAAPARARSADRFQLCHASYSVPDLPAAQAELMRNLAPESYFGRREVFDPCSRTMRADAHLIEFGDYYITLFSGQASRLDHIGWWCPDRSDVDLATKLFEMLRWPIVLGPMTVDRSYLVHFRGPDGRVHDVFSFEAAA